MRSSLVRFLFVSTISPLVTFCAPVLSFSLQGHITEIVNPGGIPSPIQVGDTVTYTLFADFATVYGLGSISGNSNPQPPGFYTEYYQIGPQDGVVVSVNTQAGPVTFSTVGVSLEYALITRLWANGYPCAPNTVCPEQDINFQSFDSDVPVTHFPGITGTLFSTALTIRDQSAPFTLLSGAGFPSDLDLSAATLISWGVVEVFPARISNPEYSLFFSFDNIADIPEPQSWFLTAFGTVLLLGLARRRARAQ